MPDNNKDFARLNLLFSYAFIGDKHTGFEDLILAIAPYVNILIDSGAFSNLSARIKHPGDDFVPPITLEGYMKSCSTRYHGKVWQYIVLDVINNPTQTRINLDKMYQAGLKPMPVLTGGMEFEAALEFATSYNRRICVSGGVRSGDDFIYQRYQKAFKASEGKALIHGLGFLRWPDIFKLPIATGDSSTSSGGARFGQMSIYDEQKGLMRLNWQDLFKSVSGKDDERRLKFLGFLRQANVSKEMLLDKESYRTSESVLGFMTLFAMMRMTNHSDRMGFGLFNALAGSLWLMMFMSTLDASHGTCFDYPLAISNLRKMRKMWADGEVEKLCHWSEDIFRKHTNYERNILTDSQQDYNKHLQFGNKGVKI